MIVGTPKEIKNHEHRVGLTPASVRELVAAGHRVLVQAGAGAGAGMEDAQYRAAGSELVDSAAELFARAELVVKVKEPQAQECAQLRPGQPDAELYTMSENLTVVRNVVSAVNVPVIADIDTGYGNAINVMRTIREFEASGVSAVIMEDQVAPKRCPIIAEVERKLRRADGQGIG